jgi:hypothetical protein
MFGHDKREADEAKAKAKKIMSTKPPLKGGKKADWREGALRNLRKGPGEKSRNPRTSKEWESLREGGKKGPKTQEHKKPRKRIVTVKVDTQEAKRRAGEAVKNIKKTSKKVGSAVKSGYGKVKAWEKAERMKAAERKKRRPSKYKPAPRN